MPTYLLHGFRWPRPLIRIHIILQNLDDAAAEWLVAPNTTLTLLRNLNELYPDVMEHLSCLRFIEQYDPEDPTGIGAGSQPWAYVADVVEEIKLGVAVTDITNKGIDNEQWGALMELRDKLAPEEQVSWFIVVCGDEERWIPPAARSEFQTGSISSDPARGSGTDTDPSSDGVSYCVKPRMYRISNND